MKLAPALLTLLSITSLTGSALADAYSWGGESGRFSAAITVLGFNEGAGEFGWDEASARDFSAWSRRFNAVIPPNASVSFERDPADDARLTIHSGALNDVVPMAYDSDFEAALPIVAAYFGAPVPGPQAAGKLYTLQLFASRSEASASRFAAALDVRGVAAEGSFFYESCHPCWTHEVRVLAPGRDGVHRVITGVFDHYSVARASLGKLRSQGLLGFVREL